VALLEGKVPVAPVKSIPDALRDPQVEALDMIVEYEHPTLGRVRQTGPPFKVSGYKPGYEPASGIGADTEDILVSLAGYTTNDVAQLRRLGAI
jgi:crotonobetainyl-CoA:carnitine CoA-transferase CaiB-like acyl-CoA transferase